MTTLMGFLSFKWHYTLNFQPKKCPNLHGIATFCQGTVEDGLEQKEYNIQQLMHLLIQKNFRPIINHYDDDKYVKTLSCLQ
jgi:hypothetical protein